MSACSSEPPVACWDGYAVGIADGEELYRRLGYEELFAYRVLGAMPE